MDHYKTNNFGKYFKHLIRTHLLAMIIHSIINHHFSYYFNYLLTHLNHFTDQNLLFELMQYSIDNNY